MVLSTLKELETVSSDLWAQGSRKCHCKICKWKSASEFAKGQRRYWNTCLGATNLKPDPRMRHSLQRYSTPGTRTHHPGADDLHCLVTGCLISFLYNMQHAGTFNRSLRRGQARLDPKHWRQQSKDSYLASECAFWWTLQESSRLCFFISAFSRFTVSLAQYRKFSMVAYFNDVSQVLSDIFSSQRITKHTVNTRYMLFKTGFISDSALQSTHFTWFFFVSPCHFPGSTPTQLAAKFAIAPA